MEIKLTNVAITNIAREIINCYKLCDHCLGRLFAKIEHGLTNNERGEKIRKKLKTKKTDINNCELCEGLFKEIQHFADIVIDEIKNYEFETYLIGAVVDDDVVEKEEQIWETFGLEYAEPVKTEINREVGKLIGKHFQKDVNFKNPDIMAVINTSFDVVNCQVKSVYVYGRYLKHVRGIPQTRWPCRVCRGVGCKKCDYTGKMYETSVEELIAKKLLEETEGDEEAFHGCGREDIDALMLGNGRPFVLEIKNPRKKKIDLSVLEKKINVFAKGNVVVKNLRFSDKKEVIRLKNADFKKTYRVLIHGEKPISKEKLNEAAQILQDKLISQRTPLRVVHRRADLVREKKLINCKVESVAGHNAKLVIETDPGMYVKELISGDMGRTKPSVSEMIDNPCMVKELDVIKVEGE
ncbi:TIGR01213 family protein [Thermoplasmatales archaeon SCGC AB-539-N05]|nr:TIGR01213 family protein [Thermoplasmatales archaeon SCGC AB-539-N05]